MIFCFTLSSGGIQLVAIGLDLNKYLQPQLSIDKQDNGLLTRTFTSEVRKLNNIRKSRLVMSCVKYVFLL